MELQAVAAAGPAYLALVTELLQRQRTTNTEIGQPYETDWLDVADRPVPQELPDGYTLLARPDQTGPHPMIKCNGAEVEARLQLKVSHDSDNEPARRLYHGAGFEAEMQVSTLVRPAAD